jgi:hypothetical protein
VVVLDPDHTRATCPADGGEDSCPDRTVAVREHDVGLEPTERGADGGHRSAGPPGRVLSDEFGVDAGRDRTFPRQSGLDLPLDGEHGHLAAKFLLLGGQHGRHGCEGASVERVDEVHHPRWCGHLEDA